MRFKNKYEHLNIFGCAAITNAGFILGTNAGVHTQPNQTSNRGGMLLLHGQQIHIDNYDMSKMHHNKPVDHQHQYACPPPSYEDALNTSEPAGKCERL